ncbi:unnamed protein product [Heterobilharzia americana]|nr:unnamed protein product [Heterobilharzia americana]
MTLRRVSIIGSGNWGSTIAKIVGNNVKSFTEYTPEVRMWVHEEMIDDRKLTEIINTTHENVKYLPGVKLPDNVVAIPDVSSVARDADVLVIVMPHQFLDKTLSAMKSDVKPSAYAVSLMKGLALSDDHGIRLLTDCIREILKIPCAALMGANLATEVSQENYCEATIGIDDAQIGSELKKLFQDEDIDNHQTGDAEKASVFNIFSSTVADSSIVPHPTDKIQSARYLNSLVRGKTNPDHLSYLKDKLYRILVIDYFSSRTVILVTEYSNERDAIQKKAFTNWVNQHLVKRNCWVQDLFLDLRNGYLLVRLLECLTNEVLGLEYIESRVHWIQNIQRVLDFLRYRGIRIVNIRADEIVDGNPKLTLGLIWIIILHFQLAELIEDQTKIQSNIRVDLSMDNAAKQTLLSWCRAVTSNYPGVYVKDFSESWGDGRGFLALIHRYRPDLIDFRQVDRQSARENLDLAFDLAERELEVTRLFDPDDISKITDERSIMTYVASLYDKLVCNSQHRSSYPLAIIPPMPSLYHDSHTPGPVDSTFQFQASNQLPDELKSLWSDYRVLASDLIQWLRSTTDRLANRHFPSDLKAMQERVMDEIRRHRRDERPRRERERQQLVRMYEELKPSIERGILPVDIFLRIEQILRLWDEYDVALQERELAARNEIHRLDRLQWAGNRALRDCVQVQAQLTALQRRVAELPTRSQEEKQVLNESLQLLEQQYQQLVDASSKRRSMAQSLLEFVERASNELIWLRERESCEVTRKWTEIYYDGLDRVRIHFQKLMHEIHEKEVVYNELSVLGSSIQLENYSVTDLVQTYLNALERHWAWLLQLTYCFEAHIEQGTRFQSFFNDVKQCELLLTTALEELRSHYESTLKATTAEQGETLLKQLQELYTRVIGQETFIFQLVDLSQEIVPPIPDNLNSQEENTSAIIGRRTRVLCSFQPKDYFIDSHQRYSGDLSLINSVNTCNMSIVNTSSIIEPIFWPVGDSTGCFDKGDFLTILENPEAHRLQVRTANGSTLTVPMICFLPCWPCSEAMDRAKCIVSTLQHFKTCWSELNLRLRGHLLTIAMSKFIENPVQHDIPQQMDLRKVIYHDAERYCLELQLVNTPLPEVDKFKQNFILFQNSCIEQLYNVPAMNGDDVSGNSCLKIQLSEMYAIVDELRTILSTLTERLRESNSLPLPGRSCDMEVRIKEHKKWSHALARVLAQCTELEQHISQSDGQGTSSSESSNTILSTSLSALHRAASELALTGQEFACRLADADAWIARLEQTDQMLIDCELCLLGCAVRVHGLLQSDDLNNDPNSSADGLRICVVERAHRDLKSVAERLPQIRSDLDSLSQQLTRFMASSGTCGDTINRCDNAYEKSNLLKLNLSPPGDNHHLESNLACSEHRLAEATKEVEQELKAFGESLVCFSNYQKLSSQLSLWLGEFASRMRSFGEMTKSLGIKSSSENIVSVQNPGLFKEVLKQSDDLLTDLQVHSDVIEQLNREVAHLISSLTNYAERTQNYRELVENTILQTTDELNSQFNIHSRHIYDIVNCLNKLLRSKESSTVNNISGPNFVKPYRELYTGVWPKELNNRLKEAQSSPFKSKYQENGEHNGLNVTENSLDKKCSNSYSSTHKEKLIGTKELKSGVHLSGVHNQPICLLPTGWEAATLATISKAHQLYGPKIFQTSGSWFVTQLTGENETHGFGETLCVGDALRCGLFDLAAKTCRQNRSSLAIRCLML